LPTAAPTPLVPPSGCAFHPRCSLYAIKKNRLCSQEVPLLRAIAADRWVACHERG
jgi:peptide/nickel transport system ATP-binding protein